MTLTHVDTTPERATGRPPTRPGPPAAGRRRRRAPLLSILLWVLAGYFVLPLVWLVIASTKDNADLFTSFGFWFGERFSLWENLASVFTTRDGLFLRWAANTVLYAVGSAVGAAALATMAGYAFAVYRFPGDRLLFSVTLGAIMIPMTALALPTYLVFNAMGLTNTVWAIILPSLVSPFGVYLIRVYAQDAIPESLLEAARVDGAGEFRIFWQIGLRLLAPGVVTVFLFALVATWNNYFLPLIMLNSSSLYPLTVGLAQQQAASGAGGGGGQTLFSTIITGSLVSILPLVAAFLVLQRFWQAGLATGSVKE